MNRFALLVALGMLIGCAVPKWNSDFNNNRSQSALSLSETLVREQSSGNHLSILRDSVNEELMVEIIPTGFFTYSADSGFRGSAVAIRMKKNLKEGAEQITKDETQHATSFSEQSLADQHKEETLSKHENLKFSMGFYGYLLILIICIAFWFWWRRR